MTDRAMTGFYCSTSGTVFSDKEAYLDHMKSDFHRYNLKRKVAGLPPVTKEWFEARRAQLASGAPAGGSAASAKVWVDPLTKKKFMSENTYLAHTRSKKYQELLKKSGEPAPAPLILIKSEDDAQQQAQQQQQQQATTRPTSFATAYNGGKPGQAQDMAAVAEDDDNGSGWETASDEDDTDMAPADKAEAGEAEAADGDAATGPETAQEEWEEWDVRRCLFDNHVSADMDANLEYMYRNFGFYFPDAEYLKDPEGLLKYLGTKLQYGCVPLYSKGDDANAKQFRSLHAVQRHMVDRNQCKMVYEDNEDEYDQYYDYGEDTEDAGSNLILANAPATAMVLGGYELMLPGAEGQTAKVLGTREFARYYRQRHRLEDTRTSVTVNTVLAKYRSLGIALTDGAKSLEAKKNTTKSAADLRWEGKRLNKTAVWSNFVKALGKGVGREY